MTAVLTYKFGNITYVLEDNPTPRRDHDNHMGHAKT